MAKGKKGNTGKNPFDGMNLEGLSKEELLALVRARKEFDAMQDSSYNIAKAWGSISKIFPDLNKSNFFLQIKNSAQDLATAKEVLEQLTASMDSAADAAGNIFAGIFSGNKSKKELTKLLNLVNKEFYTRSPEMAAALAEGLQNGDITGFFSKFGENGRKELQKLVEDKKGFAAFKKFLDSEAVKDIGAISDKINQLQKDAKQFDEVFSKRKAFVLLGEKITRAFMPDKVMAAWSDFDQQINEVQRNFGLSMDANASRLTSLVTKTQQFGMNTKEVFTFMGQLGEELRTTNFDLLQQAALDMTAIHRATGLATDEVTQLAKQMMFYGKSSRDVASFTEDTMNMARNYGLNAKKVLADFTKSLPDARKLGWQGGEKSLRDMVMQAQKLGQTMDGLASASKKLRTLEDSLSSAAELALVGVNVNAIQMLGAARRGGKEFSDFMASITKDIGTLRKDGTVEFNPIDIDRLGVIADATGQSIEDLQNQIAKVAQRNKKIDLLPPSMFGSLSEEEKEFVLNAANIGKSGALEFNIGGVKDLSKLTPDVIKGAMSQKQSLEDMAKQNQSFKESLDVLKQTILNSLTIVQPLIEKATSFIAFLSKSFANLSLFSKVLVGAFAAFGAIFFNFAKTFYQGYIYGQGFNAAVNKSGFLTKLGGMLNPKNWAKGLFGGTAGAAAGNIPNAAGNVINNAGAANAANAAGGVNKLGDAFKNFPQPKQLLASAVALLAFGAAVVEIGYGIKIASEGLSELVKSFDGITNAGFAMGAVIAVMAGMVGIVYALSGAVAALGAAGTAGALGLLAVGAAAVMIGGGIYLAAKGIAAIIDSIGNLATSLDKISVSGTGMIATAIGVSLLTAALGGLSAIGILVGPSLLAIGGGLLMMGAGLVMTTASLSKLASLDFSSLNNLGDAFSYLGKQLPGLSIGLLTIVPAVLGLGLVGLVVGPGMLALSVGVTALGAALNLAMPSLDSLSKLKLDNLNSVGKNLLSIVPGLLAFSAVGVVSPLLAIAAGATYAIGKVLSQLSDLNLSNLIGFGDALASNIGGLFKFSSLAIVSPLLFVAGKALGAIISGLSALGNIKLDVLSSLGSNLSNLVGSLFKFSSLAIITPALLSISAGFASFGLAIGAAATGFIALQGINWADIVDFGKNITEIIPSLTPLAKIGLISIPLIAGATTIMMVGKMLGLAGEGIQSLNNVSYNGLKNIFGNIEGLIPSVSSFAKLALYATPILLIATTLGTAGLLLQNVGPGFNSLTTVNWGALSQMSAQIGAMVPALFKFSLLGTFAIPLAILGKSLGIIASGFNAIGNINWEGVGKMGFALENIIPQLQNFGSIGIMGMAGIYLMSRTLGSLADTMQKISSPMAIATDSIDKMSNSITRLKSAVNGLDTSSLKNMAEYSNKFIAAQTSNTVVVASSDNSGEKQNDKPVTINPITINLKLNGRDIHQEIVEALAYRS